MLPINSFFFRENAMRSAPSCEAPFWLSLSRGSSSLCSDLPIAPTVPAALRLFDKQRTRTFLAGQMFQRFLPTFSLCPVFILARSQPQPFIHFACHPLRVLRKTGVGEPILLNFLWRVSKTS